METDAAHYASHSRITILLLFSFHFGNFAFLCFCHFSCVIFCTMFSVCKGTIQILRHHVFYFFRPTHQGKRGKTKMKNDKQINKLLRNNS